MEQCFSWPDFDEAKLLSLSWTEDDVNVATGVSDRQRYGRREIPRLPEGRDRSEHRQTAPENINAHTDTLALFPSTNVSQTKL